MTTSDGKTVDFDPFSGPEVQVTIPATDPQKEIWLSARMGPDASCAFNESLSIDMRGPLDPDALEAALRGLVSRHESLRASFSPDGSLMCVAAGLDLPLRRIDLAGVTAEEREISLEALRNEEVSTPFDLERGPLVRTALVERGERHHTLVFTTHHIVCDGWSTAVILRDLGKLYSAARAGRPAQLPAAGRFFDYAVDTARYAGGPEAAATAAYWVEALSGAPAGSDMPSDLPRPPLRTFESDRIDYVMPADILAALKAGGARSGASLFVTTLAGLLAYLHRWSGQEDIVVGIPSAGQAGTGAPGLVGHCVNLLPIRTKPSGSTTFETHLRSVRAAVLDAQERQRCTFGRILQNLRLPRDPSRMPLLSIQFNLEQGLDSKDLGFDDLEVSVSSNPRKFENFEIFVNAVESGGKLVLEVQYNANLFERQWIERRLAGLEALLRAAAERPSTSLKDLPVIGEDESRELQSGWRSSCRIWNGPSDLMDLFERRAESDGDKPAVSDTAGGTLLTYRDLWRLSGCVAGALVEAGARPGELVGLAVSRSALLPVAMLGVSRAGAAYVPLDPSYPRERLGYMIESSGIERILLDESSASLLPEHRAESVRLERAVCAAPLEGSIAVPGGAPAYVIFTSGSTGKPKGVEVPRSCLLNFLRSMAERPGLAREDSLLAVTTLSFDIAALELLLPLTVGAKVVVATRDDAVDGGRLVSLLREHGITCMQATPSTWRLMIESGLPESFGLKALCGGEALPRDLLPPMLERLGSVWNMYGPTETTIWSSCSEISSADAPITVGRPIANTRIYVLDSGMRHVAGGWRGEVFIAGDGVAGGYLGRPDLTSERFLDDPFVPGERMYRTGDVGRFAPDGQLELLGRSDYQVKVRGFRIELGEIEAAICAAEGVGQAIATVREDVPGDVRIVAYVVPAPGEEIRQTEIRKLLRRKLPEYMIPSHIVEIESPPLTDNGKVDRKRLPAPTAIGGTDGGDVAPPETDTERFLAEIWNELLGTSRIGAHDNFFNVGGHSLLAFKVVAKADAKYGIKLPPRSIIFDSLRNIARVIDGLVAERGVEGPAT